MGRDQTHRNMCFITLLYTHLKPLNVFWVIKNSLKWNLRMMRQRYLKVKGELLDGCSKHVPRYTWKIVQGELFTQRFVVIISEVGNVHGWVPVRSIS